MWLYDCELFLFMNNIYLAILSLYGKIYDDQTWMAMATWPSLAMANTDTMGRVIMHTGLTGRKATRNLSANRPSRLKQTEGSVF
jgi:hypothetical protein